MSCAEQEPTTIRPSGPRRPDILYVTHRVPYPPDKGDRIRNYHLLKHLSRHASVHLATLADEAVSDDAVEALGRLCERVEIIRQGRWTSRLRAAASLLAGGTASEGRFSEPRLRAVIRQWTRELPYAAALVSASSLASYLKTPGLQETRKVVDLVDVDSQKWLDYAAAGQWPSTWLYGIEGKRLRCLERSLADWAHAVTLVSRAEVEIYRGFQQRGVVLAIGNGVDLEYFQPAPEVDRSTCVFVGALDYRPNIDGVVWFCREVWPEVRRRRPDARLALVGRRPAPAVQQLRTIAGVMVVGQVPDVRPYLGGATIAVAPLRIARGVQNKVLEALAMGKPVVASPEAVEGLRVSPGSHLRVADSPARWAEQVVQLLTDPDARRTLALAGRRYVEEEHRWECCLAHFGSLLSTVSQPQTPA